MTLEQNLERIATALEALVNAAKENRGNTDVSARQGQAPVPPASPRQPEPVPVNAAQATGAPVNTTQAQPVQPAATAPAPGPQWPDYSRNPAPINTQPILPGMQPAITRPPVQQPPAQPAAPPQVPVTAAPQPYTFDQLAVATANLASSGKDVFPILGRFGVQMLMDLPPERFGEYAAALREAGAVI